MTLSPPHLRRMLAQFGLLVLLLSSLAGVTPARAQSENTYFISAVDSSRFPVVTFHLRALDSTNHDVAGLSASNLPIFEDGKPVPASNVKITEHNDGPLNVAFVVDEGAQSNYAKLVPALRQSIGQLVSGGTFVDNRDRVEVAVRENPGSGDRTSLLMKPTSHGQDLLDFLSGYAFSPSAAPTKGLQGVVDITSQMKQLVPQPGTQNAVIIFIARAIEDPAGNVATSAAQNDGAEAASDYITIYAVQASVGLADQEPLKVLANSGNGQFVKLSPTVSGALDGVYQSLAAERVYFTVSYTSPYSDTGPRLITVGAPGKPTAGLTGQYQVNVTPPLVTLSVQPAELRREPIPGAAGPNPYGPASIRALVHIGWTDGITRALKSVELDVDGVKKDEKTAAQLPLGTTNVDLVADLSDMTTPGTSDLNVNVTVVDMLGNQASAQQRVTVEVVPVSTPVATPEAGSGFTLENPVVVVAMVLVVVALVLALVIILLLVRRRAPDDASHQASMGENAIGTLFVLTGPSQMLHRPIYLTRPRTVLGREPGSTDITFYAGEPSTVSRVHAVLEYNETKGFSITDKGSANGTSLNGQRLSANAPEPVRDGDEVILGDLAKKGIKLRFASGKGERWVGGVDDRTRIGL